MDFDPCLAPYTKVSSNGLVGLSIVPKTVKLLEENPFDLELGEDFLGMTHQKHHL